MARPTGTSASRGTDGSSSEAWIALTLFGGFAAGQLSSRWFSSTSVPGRSAYETGQQTLKVFGAGVRPPNVVVFHSAER